MSSKFDYFVVFAEMRTGSNFLEANLNAFPGLTCHGEAFNPHFVGYPNKDDILGISQQQREKDPLQLVAAIRDRTDGLGGFRYFHDHDPRILETLLSDPRCAKIVLTRNPAESYVSWKIAQSTGQWKLTNLKRRKGGTAQFSDHEFETHLSVLQAFQVRILNALQISGQTAFYLDYEDLQNLDVINGLGRWLGQELPLEELDSQLKKQNPESLSAKVENFEEMEHALSGLDRFNLTRTPNFEPRRGAVVPSYVAAAKAPLLYMPVPGGPGEEIATWLAALDGARIEDLQSGFSQKTLRLWRQTHPGFRSFTVLRHPLARVHHVFCHRILADGPGAFSRIRKTLCKVHNLPLPKTGIPDGYDVTAHRAAFMAFLDFVQENILGQTSIRIDPNWASQTEVLNGFSAVALPDYLIREDELTHLLPVIAARLGKPGVPVPQSAPDLPIALDAIYDEEIEARAQSIYQRDYGGFGFGPWRPQAA